ncbi:MAG: DUF2148 domain-containing protein [Desulfobacterota bacterium]|nr:DUF2148 domain-containing protein [Thermodesulfobacteriota bacterium]
MLQEHEILYNRLLAIAQDMIIAARTAPKGKGVDSLCACIVTREEIPALRDKMLELYEKTQAPVFRINGEDIMKAACIVVLGARDLSLGLKHCGFCGYTNCAEREGSGKGRCAFVVGDLGIAIGSAVAVAADRRVDTRIMYSIGYTMIHFKMLPPEVIVAHGIPLSASSKNPFFDRIIK